MISTLRQLQDLKEWAQDSTRYERRLNFRLAQKPYNWEEGNWWDLDDESVGNTKILEDFEITDEMRRRPNAEGGVQQLVQPGPGRPGYSGNIMTGSPAQQAANIKAQKETWNKIGDALWIASETGEMEYLMNSPELQKKSSQLISIIKKKS